MIVHQNPWPLASRAAADHEQIAVLVDIPVDDQRAAAIGAINAVLMGGAGFAKGEHGDI